MSPNKIVWKVNTMHTTKKNVSFSKPHMDVNITIK